MPAERVVQDSVPELFTVCRLTVLAPMVTHFKRHLPWAAGWLLASLVGAAFLARMEVVKLRESFDTETQAVHRLLSQRVAQVEAVLATLPTLPGARAQNERSRFEQRLLSVFPHVLMVLRRDADESWSDEPLRAGEAESRRLKRPVLADVNLAKGRYHLVLGQEASSYALLIDIKSMIPWQDWPMSRDTSAVQVVLAMEPQSMVLQEGNATSGALGNTRGWNFESLEPLASVTQPFSLITRRHVGWAELPWGWMASWSLGVALVLLAIRALLRQRHDRHRAEELLRVGQIGRLNTLTELATGMVIELGEPLRRAVRATRAAHQMFETDAPSLPAVQAAVSHSKAEIERAAEVVTRLRRVVEQPDLSGSLRPVNLLAVARSSLDLLVPELDRLGVRHSISSGGADVTVTADPEALAQVIHNLLINALQALQQVRPAERSLVLALASADHRGQLSVRDTGAGIGSDVVEQIFKPFFTTRQGGLGLGLSLSESLVASMDGTLTAYNRVPRGAEFCLSLPLAA